jgi:hypothetical protein
LSQPDAPIDDATVDADGILPVVGPLLTGLGLRSLTDDAAIGQFSRLLPFRDNTG